MKKRRDKKSAKRFKRPTLITSKSLPTRSVTRQGTWPNKELFFKTFPDDEAYTYLHEILIERGWKFAGKPYKGTEPVALKNIVKNQSKKLPK